MEELVVEKNECNGGWYCYFEHDGKEYYADICQIKSRIMFDFSECMIFEQITGKSGLGKVVFCKKYVPVTPDGLRACIREFVEKLREED